MAVFRVICNPEMREFVAHFGAGRQARSKVACRKGLDSLGYWPCRLWSLGILGLAPVLFQRVIQGPLGMGLGIEKTRKRCHLAAASNVWSTVWALEMRKP